MPRPPRVLAFAVAACCLWLAGPALAGTSDTVLSDRVSLNVTRDGTVHAQETVLYDGGAAQRSFVTRERVDDRRDRVFRITNLTATGGPLTVRKGDTTTATVGGSGRRTIVLNYELEGAITPLTADQELHWGAAGGWSAPVTNASVTVQAAGITQSVACFAGDPTGSTGCTTASIRDPATTADFSQRTLAAGQYLTVVTGYEPGATKGAPIFQRRHTLATAFTVDTVTGGSLVVLLALLLGGFATLYRLRGRDGRIVDGHAASAVQAPVTDDGAGGLRFDAPGGLKPGQVGTLIDEQADVIDVTATVIDLAVRGYLLIEELPRARYGRPDWQLRRLAKDPAGLLRYERRLYDALFADRDAVRLSLLDGVFSADLAKVRDAMYDDVVAQGWFTRRPDTVRSHWMHGGIALALLGLAGTIALALATDDALIGLAVIIAGAALTVGAQHMPAKTGAGATVLAQTMGLREYLYRADVHDIPEPSRVELFSRFLPYAVVFDAVEQWSHTVADVTGHGDNLYWYDGPAEWDLSHFADSLRSFTLTTSGAISTSRHFRSLKEA
jgi:Predicted membrane protein (DUF2207)